MVLFIGSEGTLLVDVQTPDIYFNSIETVLHLSLLVYGHCWWMCRFLGRVNAC